MRSLSLFSLSLSLLSGSLEGVTSEFRIEPSHLGTRKVAEVVPHLGLPVRGPSRRHAL